MQTQILILGSGPAGCTAAFYAAEAGFQTTLLMGICPGGQLILTDAIDNFPAQFGVSGIDLTDKLIQQAQNAGAKLIYEQAEDIRFDSAPFLVRTNTGFKISADSIIIATGASAKWMGIKGESRLIGHGISVCATCDGPFFKGKTVAVIGSGNSAVYEALFLSKLCEKVFLIYTEKELHAEHSLIQKLHQRTNINQLPTTEVLEFEGDEKLSALIIKNKRTNLVTRLPVSGAFEAIGRIPNTQLFQKQLDLSPQGYILTNPDTLETSVKGVFACGDVQEQSYRQAIIAAAAGCRAALSAKHYLIG